MRRTELGLLLSICLPWLAACEIEWGGAQVTLESPAREKEETHADSSALAEMIAPLPDPPLLFRVRIDADGSAIAAPVAHMDDSLPADMVLPADFNQNYRARFDSAFLAPGTELALFAGGARIGSAVLTEGRFVWDSLCPSAVDATPFLIAGQQLPVSALAFPVSLFDGSPGAWNPVEPDRRIRTFGPILTETLLKEEGYDRAFLAQRAALGIVTYEGDADVAMAATYLVNDSLTAEAREGPAVSLFFIARYDPARGYYPIWHEYRRYDSPVERELFVYLDWLELPVGRVDFLEAYGDGSVQLAASIDRSVSGESGNGERKIDWVESSRCSSIEGLGARELVAEPPKTPVDTTAGATTGGATSPAPARADTPAVEAPVEAPAETG